MTGIFRKNVSRRELALGSGAALVGAVSPAIGAVNITVQKKLNEIVSVKDFGVTGLPVDETTLAQAALNSGASMVIIPPGITVSVSTLSLAANQILLNYGIIKKLSGTTPIVVLAQGSKVFGGEINGNSILCTGAIVGSATSNIEINGVYIHNVGTGIVTMSCGVVVYGTGADNVKITNNRITNCNGQGISVEYAKNVLISGNYVSDVYHGIQFYGGDAALSQVIGCTNIVISNNIVKNVNLAAVANGGGGIWGTLSRSITIIGNHVEYCTDCGIDFEGCIDFTCTGNTAYECDNACYLALLGCSMGTFSGNSARNIVSNGSGFWAYTATYAQGYLTVENNAFHVKALGINSATGGQSFNNSVIKGNVIISDTSQGIWLSPGDNVLIEGNKIITSGSQKGITLDGVVLSQVIGNTLQGNSDPATVPTAGGGIYLKKTTTNCSYNRVNGNHIQGYVYSIVDHPVGDPTASNNDIQGNRCTNVYRLVGGTYNGLITNNINLYSPLTTLTPITF